MKMLIAYFSWSGHTKKAAEQIARATGGDLFEIVPKKKYSKIYPICAAQAKKEHDKDMRPEVAGKVENFDEYTDIVIGYPAWWYTCPMIVLSFLEQYDFTGKNVHLFNTHMGSGSTGTEDVRKHCKGNVSQSLDANSLTDEKIKNWLE